MFLTSSNDNDLFENFDKIGLKNGTHNKNILIKINLSRICRKNHPRTDMPLLRKIVKYIFENDGKCAITEGSDGFLNENLQASGFDDMLKYYGIKVIDVDLEECDEVFFNGEYHYIPKCFQEYQIGIAIPATSKRLNMLYSNNVKLFFGAVPRKMYQLENTDILKDAPRSKLHQNLHFSVANLFLAINSYINFGFFINGGLSYNENRGEFMLEETFVGNDAMELDSYIFEKYFNDCEFPDYLNMLRKQK